MKNKLIVYETLYRIENEDNDKCGNFKCEN